MHGGRAHEALLALHGRRVKPLVVAGAPVPRGGTIADLFPDTVDPLERAGPGRGGVAFQVALAHARDNAAVLVAAPGILRSKARAGDEAPGGGTYRAFGTPALGSGGAVAFVAQLEEARSPLGLFLRKGRRSRALGFLGRGTRTRLTGNFTSFDPPVAGGRFVAFRARVGDLGQEGVFLADRTDDRTLVVAVASGETGSDGRRFRSFGRPVLAGDSLVFHADVADPDDRTASAGFYRVRVADALVDPTIAAVVDAVLLLGDASPLGGTFLAFGAPAGNAQGALAYTADVLGGRAARAVFYQPDLVRAFD